ncbi:MAG: RIO1 family regulatory kinase/ATPase domain-containing protein [Candidatus Hodarchaeales archaeon]
MKIINHFRDITRLQFRILAVIEILMARHEFVPLEEIVSYMSYSEKKIENELRKLRRLKLIIVVQRHYLGTALTFIGYDALALKALVEKGVISQIGPEIGAGKESNIRLVLNDDGEQFLIKLHRLGKLDFRLTKKAREYIAKKHHISPLYESRLSAEREFKALTDLYNSGVSVPKPIAQNRHIVTLEIITGEDLYKIKKSEFTSESDIMSLFENILHEVKQAAKCGYLHGDLSEYNIRLNEDNYPVLFDWPQYVKVEAINARDILKHDIENILNYFKKKFKVRINIDIEQITDEILNIDVKNDW